MGKDKKKITILIFFSHQLSKEIISGGEKMFLAVSKRFSKFSIESYSVVPELAVDSLKKENLNSYLFIVPCFKFEYNPPLETLKDFFRIWFIYIYRSLYGSLKIFKWLKKSSANVVYSTGDFIPDTVPVVIAKLGRKKFKWIVLIHHIIENPFKRKAVGVLSNIGSFLMQRFSFFLIKYFADGIFVKNNGVKSDLSEIGFNVEKMFIIDNGVDLKRIKDMPSDYPEPFDACYIGRLSASKGISDLINIWSTVVKSIPSARLAIIGGGSSKLEEAKKNDVQELNLQNNIRILGSLPDEEAYKIRKTSKLFLSCSFEEGWGISVAESLACGIPCVAYDLPVYSEKFGKAVATVHLGDLDGFANRVISLLKDENKRNELGLYGKEIVKRYDIEKTVEQEVNVIRKILAH